MAWRGTKKRRDLTGVHVVITTYTVLSRDIEEMAGLPWHMVVLDEAQAIKSPTAKATHAVCRFETRHRLCLSGTPIENNLGELWSQFAFLMPGLLGRAKVSTAGSGRQSRRMAIRCGGGSWRHGSGRSSCGGRRGRWRRNCRQSTPSCGGSPWPPDQRELYETIRATMHEKVVAGIAARGVAQSHVLVLQALLKLRQVCCDPRLAGFGRAGRRASWTI